MQDTHLYEVKSKLPMNYDYKGVPEKLTTKIIGYAPESTFVNDGWSGAVEFLCAYHEATEIATHLVNKKITTMDAIGSRASGFVYEVE